MPSDKEDCDQIFKKVIDLEYEGYCLFDLADCFINGYDIENLRCMLKSSDEGVILDGLFVADEIGDLVTRVADEVRNLCTHEDLDIKRRAFALYKKI